jgi:hypothetical protein
MEWISEEWRQLSLRQMLSYFASTGNQLKKLLIFLNH